MKRCDFGRLVSALRQEHIDIQTMAPWTRKKLAEEANLSEDIIYNIERGKKKQLDGPLLLQLAEALALTSHERQAFFEAASDIEQNIVALAHHQPDKVLTSLLRQMKQVYLPAFIIDSYCDIVAVNYAAIALLGIEEAGLSIDAMNQRRFGLNMLQFVFSPEAVAFYQPLMKDAWHDYAYQNMMIFRTSSLQYRATPYFAELFQALWVYPQFRIYWRNVFDQERDYFINTEHIHLDSPRWGDLIFFSTFFTAITTAGNLYLYVYVPVTRPTSQVFAQLMEQSGTDLKQVGHWPEKQ
jgi:transcriptional regulator with XRE-family HTH domain